MTYVTDPSVTGTAAERAQVLTGHAQYLIATAGRAPSVHNSQPWRFRVGPETVEMWCDPSLRTWTDHSGREMLISCGAALFGLRLAVRSLGYQPVVDLLPDSRQLQFLARVRVGRAERMNTLESRMFLAVPHRHTHRGRFSPQPLPSGLLAGLQDDVLKERAGLALVRPGLPYERLAMLAASAARRGDLDPRAKAAIRRWTPAAQVSDQGIPARDGIPATALALGSPQRAQPGRLPQRDFDLGRNIGLLPAGGAPAAATAILFTREDRRADWLRAGQALNRLLLHAASAWVFASLHSQPLEDAVTRTLIHDQLGLPGHPQMVLQFGIAHTAPATPRRPPDELTC